MHRAIAVDISEQFLPWQLLTAAHKPGESRILNIDAMLLSALSLELKSDAPTTHLRMSIAHGRETVAAIILGVFVIADADERRLEQPHDGGEYLLAAHPVSP